MTRNSSPSSALLEHALSHAARGWPVFPIKPRDKEPLGRLAPHGLKDAVTDPQRIRAWWTAEPNANIGIRTGEAFDVLDIDTDEGYDAIAALAHDSDLDLATVPQAATGGGGRHLFFAACGRGNRAGLVPGVDWRGAGGYVVGPGSTHPSGARYSWILEPADRLPEVPGFLRALLEPRITSPVPGRGAVAAEDRPADAYVESALREELDRVRTASPGTRNHQLNRSAFAIGQMVAAGWIPEHLAEAELRAAAFASGLEEPEVSRTIRSGLHGGRAEPRSAPEPPGRPGGEIRGRHGAEQVPPPAPAVDLDALIEPGPLWAARAAQRVQVIIPGFLVAGGLGMLISDPKAGKTWLGLELVVCVANGVPVFGRYPVERPGRVLYVATEGSREGSKARLFGLARGHGLEPSDALQNLDFIWRRGVHLDDDHFAEQLAAVAPRYTLIVVDVLVEAWRGDENKAAEVAGLMRRLRPITDGGATILLLHHLNKQQSDEHRSIWQRIRGSTALFGAFDSGIGLERPVSAKRTRVSFQHRDDAPTEAFTFTWPEDLVTGDEPVTLDWRPADDDELATQHEAEAEVLAYVAANPGQAMREVAAAVKGRRKAHNEAAIRALIGAGRLRQQATTGKRSDGRIYHLEGLFVASPKVRETAGDGGGATLGLVSPTGVMGPVGAHPAGDGTSTESDLTGDGRFLDPRCPRCRGRDYTLAGPIGSHRYRCVDCGNEWAA